MDRTVEIPVGAVRLEGDLRIPDDASGVVIFAHGSGSSRHSPRNRYVANYFRSLGLATLLFDLLTPEEESVDVYTRHLRFDIPMLAERLVAATYWLQYDDDTASLPAGYFGASTGGGAALVAAAKLGSAVSAVVSRGGRPDLAGEALTKVTAPTLLIVGELDVPVIAMNETALAKLQCEKMLEIVPGASHLFEERGALERVAMLASIWFSRYLRPIGRTAAG